MSLNGALQVGRSAIQVSQAALQVAGNNMANAATPGFHRRSVHLATAPDQQLTANSRVGTGVQLERIRREVDTALQARHRDALAQENAAVIDQRFLSSIESIQNELSDNDLSSMLSEFFNAFSELANNPDDNAMRSVVIQQGVNLAGRVSDIRGEYGSVRNEIDRELDTSAATVNELLDQVATLNREIALTEQGITEAASLRDQRDLILDELSEYMDITVIEQANGAADVHVNSIPVVLGTEALGIEFRFTSVGEQINVSTRVAANGTQLDVRSGRIGALVGQRQGALEPAIETLNTFAGELINQVNRLHSQGQGTELRSTYTGAYTASDTTAAINSIDSGLPFEVENGSFFIHVTHVDSGTRITRRIDVDGNTTSVDDILNDINTVVNVPNVSASLSPEQQVQLSADAGFEISFSDDTSGALAALGINSFFVGDNATNIDVHQDLLDDPKLLAAGANHVPGSNETALAIAALQDDPVATLNDQSLREYWQQHVNGLAVQTDSANAAVQAKTIVRESIAAQIQSVSGVSLDEESVNLLTYQRQFQAAARFITVIDESLRTLLSIV